MKDGLSENNASSLCAPNSELTCFGCCPPIRPPGYDHLKFARSLKRELRENRFRLLAAGPAYRPIVGYSCWALGYLDTGGRRIGCMLHPCGNHGRDLRSLIDYGDKCQREICFPAKMYSLLPSSGRQFWLEPALGLSAFYFSSPQSNPLFHILLWGPELLEMLRSRAESCGWTATELLCDFPFLTDSKWSPKAQRYLFRLILQKSLSMDNRQIEACAQSLWLQLLSEPCLQTSESSDFGADLFVPHTHQLPMEEDFLDFLRLGFGRRKTSLSKAKEMKLLIDERLTRIDSLG